jgi:hypothetical protein
VGEASSIDPACPFGPGCHTVLAVFHVKSKLPATPSYFIVLIIVEFALTPGSGQGERCFDSESGLLARSLSRPICTSLDSGSPRKDSGVRNDGGGATSLLRYRFTPTHRYLACHAKGVITPILIFSRVPNGPFCPNLPISPLSYLSDAPSESLFWAL